MYAEERQQDIVQLARRHGRVEVSTLADRFSVTTETVRRDLSRLERHGLLKRVHGGAIPIERLGFEPEVSLRSSLMTAEKERIAKAAVAEIPLEGSLLLDAGTTTAALAAVIPADRELTVITNAPSIAMSLAARPLLTVLLVGGRLRGRTLAAVGPAATSFLHQTHVDVAFMGTNGFSVLRGLTTPDPTEADTKRAMIAAARRVVVLADHTKLGADALMRFGTLSEVDVLITDVGLDHEMVDELERAGPRVVRT